MLERIRPVTLIILLLLAIVVVISTCSKKVPAPLPTVAPMETQIITPIVMETHPPSQAPVPSAYTVSMPMPSVPPTPSIVSTLPGQESAVQYQPPSPSPSPAPMGTSVTVTSTDSSDAEFASRIKPDSVLPSRGGSSESQVIVIENQIVENKYNDPYSGTPLFGSLSVAENTTQIDDYTE